VVTVVVVGFDFDFSFDFGVGVVRCEMAQMCHTQARRLRRPPHQLTSASTA